jgi:hypothetical protein
VTGNWNIAYTWIQNNSGAALVDTNNYVSSLSFSGTNKILTLGRTGMAALTAVIDLGWAKDANGFSYTGNVGIGGTSVFGIPLTIS